MAAHLTPQRMTVDLNGRGFFVAEDTLLATE
jgi:hypothetical protein